MNVIETQGLRRSFGLKDAVRRLDLAVPAGSVCALLGPNGAGKTTTIKMLMGLLRPSAGTGRVLGADVTRLDAKTRARIGYVSENQELPEWMTVRAFLDYCRAFYPTWDRELEASLLTRFNLPEDGRLKQLSRGMRMKAMLLAALAYRPELLVMDEPFSGLDPAVREDLVGGVFEAAGEGWWSVLISSHDIDEVERFADWVAIIEDGELTLSESLESLQARCRKVEITLAAEGGIPDQVFPETWRRVEEAGRLLRFVDTEYRAKESEEEYGGRFPGAVVAVEGLSLRGIYLAITSARGAQAL